MLEEKCYFLINKSEKYFENKLQPNLAAVGLILGDWQSIFDFFFSVYIKYDIQLFKF